MPISVVCGSCQTGFTLKDEFAGRKVRCSSCQTVIEIPAADLVSEADFGVPGLDPVFQRDKFFLNQKVLSINTRYMICDEQEQVIMHAIRPIHYFRSILMAMGVFFVLMVMVVGLVIAGIALPDKIGDAGAVAVCIVLFVLTIVAVVATKIVLSPKRHITFYRDEALQEKVLEILQDQKFTFRMATYTVLDPNGEPLGRFRKDYLANILRKRWDGFDFANQPICIVREDSIILSIMRRFLGSFYGLLRTNFIILPVSAEKSEHEILGEFNRKFTIRDRYVLDLTHDRGRSLDRRMAIAIGVLLDTAEKR